ncbi:NAD(P)-binding Rossmann-fold containing protein [Glarea lozoyensis ATCC 20868]|uniref:NAD(P)-binding Rossmann-fold containing protein n=1 Tax=Glarea lozoyensis (strain ATCC 20868 / MF5171) TaxID=1116229 RepID=S3EAM7_GLAL2|nr:NAD(P)-binding Rossmann-fold containing protein [Glarea lozoyensis ATCC 20868]EPE35368.1 NAD(P)-binding Rossmann-fold containing protein [Glarea lozoyensis ATCC 20868]
MLPPDPSILPSLLGPPPPPEAADGISRWAVKNPPKDPTLSFAGKTVLVTGSNTGLGYEAALKFANLGATLILAVRTPSKGETAKTRILAATGVPSTRISVLQLDMSTFASIRTFLATLTSTTPVLHIALLNAGLAAPKFERSPDGWEMALQVNVLSTAFLALGLLPLLRATAKQTGGPGQVTFTNSAGHRRAKGAEMAVPEGTSILETFNRPEFFSLAKNYMLIKLLGMYVMRGLHEQFSVNEVGERDVLFNACCPGYCRTELGREMPWYVNGITRAVQSFYGRSAEEGGRSLVSATRVGIEGAGRFWSNDWFTEMGELVTSEEGKRLQVRAWKEILEVCRKEGLEKGV